MNDSTFNAVHIYIYTVANICVFNVYTHVKQTRGLSWVRGTETLDGQNNAPP